MTQTRLGDHTPRKAVPVPAHALTATDRERLGEIDAALLSLLSDNQWHDRGDLTVKLRGAVVHSAAARLRKKGYRVDCRRGERPGSTEYRLRDVVR